LKSGHDGFEVGSQPARGQTHCRRGSRPIIGMCPDPLLAWVCSHGSPVRGSFFGCGSADVGLWPWVSNVGLSLVVCLGLFGDLSQNKLGDVSPCGWMLQNTIFVDGSHGRGSHFLHTFSLFHHLNKTCYNLEVKMKICMVIKLFDLITINYNQSSKR
jgi:hypothetical protein